MIGKRIVHYEVREKLGAGGMGEVWRASDSKLGRDVALKVLPELLAADAERMLRFQREAQVLASLNHPNIGAIYGLESAEGLQCLVLELVRGETLADRIQRGALPVEEALGIARQIAEAMESAHEQGVLHRDLKPGNVMITPDGVVKVLDFGLAKAFEPESANQSLSLSPTITHGNTMAGMILGTAGYMSPEQAKGKPVDRRADIWAFGVVLFEMLTGRQAFTGETASEVLAAVMMREIAWGELPKDLPAPVMHLLRRCLDKDPRRRLRDMGEARLLIEDYLANPTAAAFAASAAAAAPAPAPRAASWPWLVAGAFATIAVLVAWAPWRSPAKAPAVMEFDVELAPAPLFPGYGTAAVLSRQGDRIAFVTEGEDRRMYVRDLSDPVAREIAGTTQAYHPFFSPAGDWIGFFTRTELKKVSIRGGAPLVLAPVSLNRGGTWTEAGEIIFAPNPSGPLMKIADGGGQAVAITQLDSTAGETSHRWPHAIPGRRAVLFAVFATAQGLDQGRLEVLDLASGKRKVLHHGGSDPRYVPTGHILYVYQQTLFALPFDAKRLEVTGPPAPVLEQLRASASEGAAQYDVSLNGTLIGQFGEGGSGSLTQLVRIPLQGGVPEVLIEPMDISGPAVSPDGQRVAYSLGQAAMTDVWVLDLVRGTRTRLTFEEGKPDWHPIWSPDGKFIVYSSGGGGARSSQLQVKAADGSGEQKRLSAENFVQAPEDWTPDGTTILFSQNSGGSWGLWKTSATEVSPHEKVVDTPALEISPRVSPDGRWLAYQSAESGRPEVYVRPFPGPGGKWQVSTRGGGEPRWSRRGWELFYRSSDSLYSAKITPGESSIEVGRPVARVRIALGPGVLAGTYDLTPDGSAVIAAAQLERDRDEAPFRRVRLTLNWFERLKQAAPVAAK